MSFTFYIFPFSELVFPCYHFHLSLFFSFLCFLLHKEKQITHAARGRWQERVCWFYLTFIKGPKLSLVLKWGYGHFPCDILAGLKAGFIQHSTLIFNYEPWNYASAFLMNLGNVFISGIASSWQEVALACLKLRDDLVMAFWIVFVCLVGWFCSLVPRA